MITENKYYTPSIEEFRVGFEYQLNHSGNKVLDEQKVWKTEELSLENLNYLFNRVISNSIRVKYLDREDIETLGFKASDNGGYVINLSNKTIRMWPSNSSQAMEVYENPTFGDTFKEMWPMPYLFKGTIKNKSELQVLMRQLNIT